MLCILDEFVNAQKKCERSRDHFSIVCFNASFFICVEIFLHAQCASSAIDYFNIKTNDSNNYSHVSFEMKLGEARRQW